MSGLRQNGLMSERLRWYCDYACRDDYGLKLEHTSAWAGLFYFCSRVRESGDESQQFITFPRERQVRKSFSLKS